MGWFTEQIQQRVKSDDDTFSQAFASLAGVVMGERLSKALNDSRMQARDAIEQILKFYKVKPVEVPDEVKELNDQLEYLMRPAGIMRRTVCLKGAWYKDAVGAMLGFNREDQTPLALIPDRFWGYRYYDTKTGEMVKITAKNAHLIDSEAICFYKPFPLKKIGIMDLLLYIRQMLSAADFVLAGFATLAATLVGFLIPKINNIIYAHVITSSSLRLLYAVFAFLFCVTLSQTLLDVSRGMLLGRFSGKCGMAVQAAGMMRILSLPPAFFREYSSGDLAARMEYMEGLCQMLLDSLLSVGLTSVFSLAYIAQMAKFGPGLVIPGLIVIFATVGLSLVSTLMQIRVSSRQMEYSAREYGMTYSLINGVQKIKLVGAEKRAFAKWAEAYRMQAKLEYDPPAFLKFGSVATSCVSLVGTLVIYYFTIKTGVKLADYYAFQASYGMVMGAFSSLIGMAATFAQIKPVMNMVKPILENVPEQTENKKVVTRLSGGIELNNVSFRYKEDSPDVLQNLSLKIRPGQYVAIVGKTGCGKSTLMRLMLGFETPKKGAVYYDGKDLNSLDLKYLRRKIGVVMQDGKLFSGDIYSNITISAPWLTLDDAWEAAEMAGMAEDIRNMPMEMHTMISEGSGGISGGQRQRLLIARAIAPKPRILMFDEATSALDNMTQKQVSESLNRLKCTRIVIAHRLSTIQECDRIIVLDGGRIIEDGTYQELLEKKGFFAELVERQRVDV